VLPQASAPRFRAAPEEFSVPPPVPAMPWWCAPPCLPCPWCARGVPGVPCRPGTRRRLQASMHSSAGPRGGAWRCSWTMTARSPHCGGPRPRNHVRRGGWRGALASSPTPSHPCPRCPCPRPRPLPAPGLRLCPAPGSSGPHVPRCVAVRTSSGFVGTLGCGVQMRAVVKEVAGCFPTAIISGRGGKVRREGMGWSGSHRVTLSIGRKHTRAQG